MRALIASIALFGGAVAVIARPLAGSPVAGRQDRAAGPADSVALFPEVAGWKFAPPPGSSYYTADNLWNIIDGAADVFLANGFVDLRIGEYADSAGTDVRVEVYRHNSRANAFGIYSQERNPGYHFIDVGTQGYTEEKVLNFLCGICYVKISSHTAGARGLAGMRAIANALESALRQDNTWPKPLLYFPAVGKRQNEESYVAENFLGYGALSGAFVARYDSGYRMFVIPCASPESVRTVAAEYEKAAGSPTVTPEPSSLLEIRDPHNGVVFLRLLKSHLIGILGCPSRDCALAELSLLEERIALFSNRE